MRRIEYFELLSNLYDFKSIFDKKGTEYVLFSNGINAIENVWDKTGFEALENHVHLLDNVKADEFNRLIPVAQNLGQSLLYNLKSNYPSKHFMVYVTIHLHDSMIIRFHQKWDNEAPYCNPDDFNSPNEKAFLFEN